MKNARSIFGMVCLAALAILPAGCLKEDNPGDYRLEHTLIFCGMGFNNISSSITGVDVLTGPAVLGEALRYAMKAVPSDSYGFIFSSHGTGWLPKGYYSTHGSLRLSGAPGNGADTFSNMPGPPVKNLGNEFAGSESNQVELDLPEFVNSFPMHADSKPDLRAVCTEYYRKYADGNSYATVSLID